MLTNFNVVRCMFSLLIWIHCCYFELLNQQVRIVALKASQSLTYSWSPTSFEWLWATCKKWMDSLTFSSFGCDSLSANQMSFPYAGQWLCEGNQKVTPEKFQSSSLLFPLQSQQRKIFASAYTTKWYCKGDSLRWWLCWVHGRKPICPSKEEGD